MTENSESTLSPLDQGGLDAEVAAAQAAIATATDLAQLKEVRNRFTAAPLTLAKRLIGGLDPEQKATAGKNLGAAQSAIKTAYENRATALETEAQAQQLSA